jgi:hypothetical protein
MCRVGVGFLAFLAIFSKNLQIPFSMFLLKPCYPIGADASRPTGYAIAGNYAILRWIIEALYATLTENAHFAPRREVAVQDGCALYLSFI